MQAKDKEKRNFKRFSKRFLSLSGIRRGKRGIGYGENSSFQELDDTVTSKSLANESGQGIASLLNEDLEATISLDGAPGNVDNEKADTQRLLPSPLQTADLSLNLNGNAVQNPLSPGPVAPLLELGDCMNTSRDSGIDCSVLMSEKSSPEQFVAFSRREAERIRQEHLQYMNGSVLETLNEAERSSSEDSDPEGAIQGADGGTTSNTEENFLDTADKACHQEDDFESSETDNLLTESESRSKSELVVSNQTENDSSYSDRSESVARITRSRLDLNNGDESPCLLSQMLMSNNESPDETVQNLNRSRDSNTSTSLENHVTPVMRNSDISITTSMEQYLLNSVENKTDERKSAEARVQQTTTDNSSVSMECPHLIVSPIAVRSAAVVAGHKTIPPTPTPASLYINENSAFAKCKSIKRSVSDVGKGILGKLRQKKREQNATKASNDKDTAEEKLKYETKKFISGRLKKINKKKEKLKKDPADLNESVLIVDVATDKKLSGYISDTNLYVKEKSSVTKEILHCNRNPVYISGSSEYKVTGKSPVVKEVVPDFDKKRLSQNLDRSSPETIEDLTNSIAEMTSRLCIPGQSSAESIECICDCKHKSSSDQECCDKRKTPTPPGLLQSSSREMSKRVQLEVAGDNRIETRTCSSLGNICDEEQTKLLDNFEQADAFNFAGGEEDMSDNYDTETDSDGECSDLSCTDCCSAPERKSGSSESSSDSDDDKIAKSNSSKLSQYHLDHRDSTGTTSTSDTSSSSSPVESILNSSSFRKNHDTSAYDVTFRELDSSPGRGNLRHLNADLYDSIRLSDAARSVSGYDSPASAAGFTDFEESPSAYKEFDHINGDVMYLGNESELFQESFFLNPCDNSMSSPYGRLPTETPASSPRSPNSSLEGTPVPLNRSPNSALPSSSQGCRRKDIYMDNKPVNRQVSGDVYASNREIDSCRQMDCDSPVSRYNTQHSTSSLRRSHSQNEKLFRAQRQNPRTGSNQSYSKLNRSTSSVDSPNRSYSRSAAVGYRLNSSSNRSFSGLNVSANVGNEMSFTLENQHNGYTSLNDSRRTNSSALNANQSYTRLNSSYTGLNSSVLSNKRSFSQLDNSYSGLNCSIRSQNGLGSSYSGLNSSIRRQNESFSHANYSGRSSLSSSYIQDVMSTPPLDLSMSKLRKDQSRHDKWIGQIYSPADRVLHKNRGMSETDLCQQILDLYVSDAEESGFEMTLDASKLDAESPEKPKEKLPRGSPVLQYGKYVAPRNIVKETNVDDFTTRVVRKCYTAKARTRKLQEDEGQISILIGEDQQQGTKDEGQRSDTGQSETGPDVQASSTDQADQSLSEDNTGDLSTPVLEMSQAEQPDGDKTVEDVTDDSVQEAMTSERGEAKGGVRQQRQALRDRTNVPLSSLEMPPSLASGIDPNSLLEEAQEEKIALLMCEKSFDRLTQLYTVHNGRRKVKCLTLNESQNIIKHFPPPKEASRVSWGQTISELDLYRHSPRRTPVKTRPILTQKENNFPYDDDTPSPIVLTKMRKPKSLAKRYKNWPWY